MAAGTDEVQDRRRGRSQRFRWGAFAKGVLIGIGVYLGVAFLLDLLPLPPLAVGLLSLAAGAVVGTRTSGVERTPNGYVIVGGAILLVLMALTAFLWWLAGTTLSQ